MTVDPATMMIAADAGTTTAVVVAGDRDRFRDGGRPRRDGMEDVEVSEDDVLLPVAGILDVLDNYAFVRTSGYLPGPERRCTCRCRWCVVTGFARVTPSPDRSPTA